MRKFEKQHPDFPVDEPDFPVDEVLRDYVRLHECAPLPAAQRNQTRQAPSPGPSEQILTHVANGASSAPVQRRGKGRGRERLMRLQGLSPVKK